MTIWPFVKILRQLVIIVIIIVLTTQYLATPGCSREKWLIRMPKGKLQVPSTLTTRKCVNRTRNPILCKHLATLRAAVFAASSLQMNRHQKYSTKSLICFTTVPSSYACMHVMQST